MPFMAISKEYELREDETVRELKERVQKDLNMFVRLGPALQQDGRTLSEDANLREANFDVQRPLVFARR